jgi:hypothetical protein
MKFKYSILILSLILLYHNANAQHKKVKNTPNIDRLEGLYGERMVNASDRKDWLNFGKYYALYYATAYSRSIYHINNFSWSIVEHVTDPKVLEIAVKTMKYDIEHFDQNSVQAYDTYACLFYKTGRKQEALKWEEKAVKVEQERASKENRKPDPLFAETLEKMKAGTLTWVVEDTKD